MRTLSVGSTCRSATTNALWTDQYSVKDYNAVFLDLRDVVESDDLHTPDSTTDCAVRFPDPGTVVDCCQNGIDFHVVLPTDRGVDLTHISEDGYDGERSVDVLSWLPFDVSVTAENGESVDTVRPGWQWCFQAPFPRYAVVDRVRQDSSPESGAELLSEFLTEVQPTERSLAETAAGDSVGSVVDLTPLVQSFSPNSSELQTWPGKVHLLQVPSSRSYERLVEGILEHEYGQDVGGTARDTPAWTDQFALGYENDLKQQLEIVRKFKRLTWASGDQLENCVGAAFKLLGADVTGEKPGEYDRLVRHRGGTYVLEITGQNSAIGVGKARQLEHWVSDFEDANDEAAVGLLVGNAHRDDPPNERADRITQDAREHLASRGNRFLPTAALLDGVLDRIQGERTGEEILDRLLEDVAALTTEQD